MNLRGKKYDTFDDHRIAGSRLSIVKRRGKTKGQKAEEIVVEMVESLTTSGELSDEEFERLANELADYVEKNLPPDAKPLSDYAMSREGIYEDHL